ncbi:DNA repair protein RecO [Defluviimonas sp. WL0002]|uniref:DNA repair protein RecO n=1 Tax=Albidovulum marisflavi TaxID=2984159 RepID=A0ABT2ZA23_9RHOB|nr:DNA repair protein RecO [Defluviimonas sp. WL0002]MCV2867979.1 DNA repair protein RecO [Defluviimonas sp. WL0002]
MEWRDQGALLSVRPHGETSAIIEVFTAHHGRHAGVVRGGASRRVAPILQPGAQLDVTWRARLDEHIGAFVVEPLRARSGVLSDRLALAGLNSVCALLRFALPEREAHPALYRSSIALLDALGSTPDWLTHYLRWEAMLLEELGYGLDLSSCAVTGSREDLAYVSPRSGRAVGRDAAGQWADRLLPLPPCLLGQGAATTEEVVAGLGTTGWFLEHRLASDLGTRPLPEARHRFVALLARQG